MAGLKRATVLAAALVGVLLLAGSSVSAAFGVITGAKQEVPFTTVDFVIRTGGRLDIPVLSDEHAYPIGHDVNTPGNRTMNHIEEFVEFSIFYQFVLAFGILDNGSEKSDAVVPEIPGARYRLLMNLSTMMEIEASEAREPLMVDRILNFQLNESTSHGVILPRGTTLVVERSGMTAVFGYYYASTPNEDARPISEMDLVERWVEIPFTSSLNLTLHASWSICFESPSLATLRYLGEGVVGRYLIHKDSESYASLDGYFRCYFQSTEVSVMASPAFLGELLLGACGSAIVIVAAVSYWRTGRSVRSAAMPSTGAGRNGSSDGSPKTTSAQGRSHSPKEM